MKGKSNVTRSDSVAEFYMSRVAINVNICILTLFFYPNCATRGKQTSVKYNTSTFHPPFAQAHTLAMEHPVSLSNPAYLPSLINKTVSKHAMQVATRK